MPRFEISGTPQEVLIKLKAAYEVASRRNEGGWPLFQDDEEWNYVPVFDERTCDICASFAGRWTGLQIPIEFPDYKTWGKAHVKPAVHITYPFLGKSTAPDAYGGCRCNLYWDDYLYVLTERLWREMEDTST